MNGGNVPGMPGDEEAAQGPVGGQGRDVPQPPQSPAPGYPPYPGAQPGYGQQPYTAPFPGPTGQQPGWGQPNGPAGPGGYGSPMGFYGAPFGQNATPPPTHLAWGIIAAVGGVLFCLIGGLPTGIASAVYARRVTSRWSAGDVQGAMQASKSARTWAIVATALDVVGLIAFVIIVVAGLHSPASGG